MDDLVMLNAAYRLHPRLDEKRQSPRVHAYCWASVDDDRRMWPALTTNLSTGGVFIATQEEIPVGTYLTVQLALPQDPDPILVGASVRWARPRTLHDDTPAGIGLAFIGLDILAKARIRRFLRIAQLISSVRSDS